MRLCQSIPLAAIVSLSSVSAASADFLLTSDLTDEILRYSNNGAPRGAFVSAGNGGLNSPQAITWGPDGNLYVAADGPIKRYNGTTGAFIDNVFTPASGELFGIAFTPSGDMLIANSTKLVQLVHFGANGATTVTNITLPHMPGKFILAPDGNMIIGNGSAGADGHQISKLNLQTLQVSTFSNSSSLNGAFGFDYGPDGLLYSSNLYGDYGIYRINPTSGQVVGQFAASQATAPSDVMFLPGTSKFWVSALLTSDLNRFDVSTGELDHSVLGGSFNWDLLSFPQASPLPEPATGELAISTLATVFARRRRMG